MSNNQINNNVQNPGFAFGLTSLIFGGLTLFFNSGWIGFTLAIAGIILGSIGQNRSTAVGMSRNVSLAGIIVSAIALGYRILYAIACGALLGSIFSFMR